MSCKACRRRRLHRRLIKIYFNSLKATLIDQLFFQQSSLARPASDDLSRRQQLVRAHHEAESFSNTLASRTYLPISMVITIRE